MLLQKKVILFLHFGFYCFIVEFVCVDLSFYAEGSILTLLDCWNEHSGSVNPFTVVAKVTAPEDKPSSHCK